MISKIALVTITTATALALAACGGGTKPVAKQAPVTETVTATVTTTVTAPAPPAKTVTVIKTVTKTVQAPPPAPVGGLLGDGTFIIGSDVQPGTYKAPDSGSQCYWELKDASGGTIDNYIQAGPAVVVIPPSAFSITTARCAPFTKVG
jgi:ABC-type Fe3+-hydroxamate transport system substrate-binding protein